MIDWAKGILPSVAGPMLWGMAGGAVVLAGWLGIGYAREKLSSKTDQNAGAGNAAGQAA